MNTDTTHGGKRENAGAPKRNIHLDKDTARMVRELAKGNEDAYVAELIRAAYQRTTSHS